GSEDCLTLDVTIPASTALHSRLPVMVYLHGGGNRAGAPPDDASPFVNQGVIVVGVRSRLDVLGFLGLPELTSEGGGSSANYAFLDQIAALRWVQENIENFGGDPRQVTIFGTSSGSFNAMALAGSPLARGLFGGAAIETTVAMNVTLADVEIQGTEF